ncbi:MAG TPA: hypothetical protein VL598_13300 [Trinickia sp.]|uniref:hypothetical protein n=1 Tax=Trinickia sp. TaxID=2571163 RepID=UPI002B68302F|nr:hypothetical protein [Trinickia sp.]HTI18636.1 hypothetical protein [Trinickia sp.]
MKYVVAIVTVLLSGGAMAQTNGTITTGTQSNAQQATNVNVNVEAGAAGASNLGLPAQTAVAYSGSYTVKSAPTVYAPSLTASVTETCWGSVSAGVSVVGVGATGAATIKDLDCNRRLNAAVAWRMDRKDIAFNIMCQDDSFRAAAAKTNAPCVEDTSASTAMIAPKTDPNLVPAPGVPGMLQYRLADTAHAASPK